VLAAFKTKDMPSASAMEASVKADIEHLSQMQNYDGGFAYWDRNYPSEPYLTVYVVNALQHAKAKGFDVPAALIDRAKPYLKDIESHIPAYYGPDIRHAISAYALYTRKQLGDTDIAKGQRSLKDWGGVDKVTMETDGWLLTVFAGNAAAQAERAAIVRYATNHVSETAGAGSIRPNIRRVYKTVGDHDDRRNVLLCREIDTNLDGIKDVVRTFNEKGEPLHEEADTNYDGKVDDWVNFTAGRIEEEDVDTTFAAGRPNVWKFYVDGQLSRIRRNTHCTNGKPDTWEIYYNDRLERVGNDATCDGHVDRWDRDTQLMAAEEAAQDKANAAAADAGPGGPTPVTVGVNGEITDGGKVDASKKK